MLNVTDVVARVNTLVVQDSMSAILRECLASRSTACRTISGVVVRLESCCVDPDSVLLRLSCCYSVFRSHVDRSRRESSNQAV